MKNDPYDARDAPDRITFSELYETSGDDFALIPDRESVFAKRLAISISEISKSPNLFCSRPCHSCVGRNPVTKNIP